MPPSSVLPPVRAFGVLLLSSVLVVTPTACNCGGDLPHDEGADASDGAGNDGGVDASSDAGEDSTDDGGGDPADGGETFDRDASCAAERSEATLKKRPVDIIFVIDNSGSMASEILAVQTNLNVNFASLIADAGIDYRVVMLSQHGNVDAGSSGGIDFGESICVSAPLSGHGCSPVPARPINTDRFFHYPTEIGSTNSFDKILDTYALRCGAQGTTQAARCPSGSPDGGWSTWLREGARKVFIEITDDNDASMRDGGNYLRFDEALLAKSPALFGTPGARDYVFHTIGGLGEKDPVTAPWLPTEALVPGKCTTNGGDSVNASSSYQQLSILTGGLRFPICQYTSFDAVFQHVAQGVIEGSTVACEFGLPAPDGGQILDPSRVLVEYTPGDGGTAVIFGRAPDAGACETAERFHVTGDTVVLCPAACEAVRADPAGAVDVLFQCVGACRENGEACTSTSDCCGTLECLVAATGAPCAGGGDCACEPVIGGVPADPAP